MQLYQPTITGSLSISGSIVLEGPITVISGSVSGTASLAETASYSQNSERLDNLDSTSFVFTSSYNVDSSSFSGRVTTIESKYATTGSNIFTSNQTICANLTTTGTITAQTINVQQVTSSVVYSCGSNIFGCAITDTQQFTGSVFITGSTLNVTGGTICANDSISVRNSSATLNLLSTDCTLSTINLGNIGTVNTSQISYDHGLNRLKFRANASDVLTVFSTGIACFASTVCAPAGLYSNCPIGINSIDAAIPLQIKRWAGSSGTLRLIGNDNVTGLPSISFCNDNGGGSAFVSMTANCQININGSIYACPSGNVGIGTGSPCATLDVNSSVGSIISATTRINDACCSEVRVGWVGGTYTRMGYYPSTAVSYIDNTYQVVSGQPFGDIQFRHNVSGTMTTRMLLKGDSGIACFSGRVCAAAFSSDGAAIRYVDFPNYGFQIGTDTFSGGWYVYQAGGYRLTIKDGGIAVFSNTVCAPTIVSSGALRVADTISQTPTGLSATAAGTNQDVLSIGNERVSYLVTVNGNGGNNSYFSHSTIVHSAAYEKSLFDLGQTNHFGNSTTYFSLSTTSGASATLRFCSNQSISGGTVYVIKLATQ